MQGRPENILTVTEILNVLFKNKRLILGTVFVALFVGFLYCIMKSPVYLAETRLVIKVGHEKLASLAVMPQVPYNVLIQERPENIQDEIEILTNPKLLYVVIPELEKKLKELEQLRGDHKGLLGLVESALTKSKKLPQRILIFLGLKRKPSSTEELFRAFRNALVVKWQEESNVIRVGFRWDDPKFAAYAANKYVDAYMRYRSRINEPQLSVEFYESQISTYKKLLRDAEKEILEFQEKYGLVEIERQKNILLGELSELQTKLRKVSVKLSEIKLKKQQIEKLLSTSEEWIETPHIGELGVSFTDLAPLDRKYFDLKAQLDSLVQIFTPEARDVKALKERIQHLRQQKADSLINILNIEEANLEDQKNNFESQVLRLQNQLKELVKRQLKYEQLQRQRKLYEDNYLLYKRKLEELRIASELDRWKIASVQVINPAVPPIDPVWPKKKLILMIIGILSLLFGIAMAFFKEMVSTKVDRGSDLEVLDIKHLATVPELKLLKGK